MTRRATRQPDSAQWTAYANACAVLKAVPGVGSGAYGLTPDSVKARPDYQVAKRAKDVAFAELRAFNASVSAQRSTERKAALKAERALRDRLKAELEATQAPLREGQRPIIATCGSCGMTWDDARVSGTTPTPSARCPFEYHHTALGVRS